MGAKHPKRTKTQVEKNNQSNNNFNKTYTYPNNKPIKPTNNDQDYMAPPPINYPIQQNITPIEENSGNFIPNDTPTSQNINQINNNDSNNIYNKPMEPSQQSQNYPQPQLQPQPNQINQINPQPQMPMGVAVPFVQPINAPGMPIPNPGYPMPYYYPAQGNPNPYAYYAPQQGNTVYVLPPGYKPERGYSPWGDLAEDLRDLF